MDRMEACWLHDDGSRCIHPGWDVMSGWPRSTAPGWPSSPTRPTSSSSSPTSRSSTSTPTPPWSHLRQNIPLRCRGGGHGGRQGAGHQRLPPSRRALADGPAPRFARSATMTGDRILLSGAARTRPPRGAAALGAQLGGVRGRPGLALDLAAAGRSDDLDRTVDYGSLAGRVAEVVDGRPGKLLEAVAEDVAWPGPPSGQSARSGPRDQAAGVAAGRPMRLRRQLRSPGTARRGGTGMTRAHVGLGSNLGSQHGHHDTAVRVLDADELTHVMAVSGCTRDSADQRREQELLPQRGGRAGDRPAAAGCCRNCCWPPRTASARPRRTLGPAHRRPRPAAVRRAAGRLHAILAVPHPRAGSGRSCSTCLCRRADAVRHLPDGRLARPPWPPRPGVRGRPVGSCSREQQGRVRGCCWGEVWTPLGGPGNGGQAAGGRDRPAGRRPGRAHGYRVTVVDTSAATCHCAQPGSRRGRVASGWPPVRATPPTCPPARRGTASTPWSATTSSRRSRTEAALLASLAGRPGHGRRALAQVQPAATGWPYGIRPPWRPRRRPPARRGPGVGGHTQAPEGVGRQ